MLVMLFIYEVNVVSSFSEQQRCIVDLYVVPAANKKCNEFFPLFNLGVKKPVISGCTELG